MLSKTQQLWRLVFGRFRGDKKDKKQKKNRIGGIIITRRVINENTVHWKQHNRCAMRNDDDVRRTYKFVFCHFSNRTHVWFPRFYTNNNNMRVLFFVKKKNEWIILNVCISFILFATSTFDLQIFSPGHLPHSVLALIYYLTYYHYSSWLSRVFPDLLVRNWTPQSRSLPGSFSSEIHRTLIILYALGINRVALLIIWHYWYYLKLS